MLKIPAAKLAHAAEALMIAAHCATDQQGLKVMADTPRRAPGAGSDVNPFDTLDHKRIRAITLGAIVALVNGAAMPDDEVPLSGFGS